MSLGLFSPLLLPASDLDPNPAVPACRQGSWARSRSGAGGFRGRGGLCFGGRPL